MQMRVRVIIFVRAVVFWTCSSLTSQAESLSLDLWLFYFYFFKVAQFVDYSDKPIKNLLKVWEIKMYIIVLPI